MGEADLPGLGHVAAADQTCIGYGMVRGAELPLNDERAVIQHCCDAEYLGGLQRLVEAKRWKYSGDALGQHGLAGPWWTDHENVVRSGCGDFHASLCVLLPIVTVSSDE